MHIFQPKHSKVKPKEAAELLKKLNITVEQLPKIKKNDAAIIDLNLKTGDIVKIERKNEQGTFLYYRVVI